MSAIVDIEPLMRGLYEEIQMGGETYSTQSVYEMIEKETSKLEVFTEADMVAMLEDLKKEMNPIKECEYQIYGKEDWNFVGKCQDIVQQKIDKLRESKL